MRNVLKLLPLLCASAAMPAPGLDLNSAKHFVGIGDGNWLGYHDEGSGAKGEIIVKESATFAIGPGMTGAWFDPAQSGHGLLIEVLPANRFLAAWVAFDPSGAQAWFSGAGTYAANTATITDVVKPSGGRWIPNFDPGRILRNAWGTLTFTFTDCNRGRVDFSSVAGFGSGSMELTRLTLPAGLACP